MNTPNLCDDSDLADVLQTQFQDRVRMADADYRNALARGVPIGTAARLRGRALREALEWRDAHGVPPPCVPPVMPARPVITEQRNTVLHRLAKRMPFELAVARMCQMSDAEIMEATENNSTARNAGR